MKSWGPGGKVGWRMDGGGWADGGGREAWKELAECPGVWWVEGWWKDRQMEGQTDGWRDGWLADGWKEVGRVGTGLHLGALGHC